MHGTGANTMRSRQGVSPLDKSLVRAESWSEKTWSQLAPAPAGRASLDAQRKVGRTHGPGPLSRSSAALAIDKVPRAANHAYRGPQDGGALPRIRSHCRFHGRSSRLYQMY
jgi:hypothetical protein